MARGKVQFSKQGLRFLKGVAHLYWVASELSVHLQLCPADQCGYVHLVMVMVYCFI